MTSNAIYPERDDSFFIDASGLPQGSWEDNGQQLKLFVPKEFSFSENMKYLSNASNECLFHIEDDRIRKAVPIGRETPIIEISAEDDNALAVRFLGHTTPACQRVRAAVACYVSEWFDLETDLRPFYELASKDVLLHRAVSEFYGLRNVGIPDLFEALCWGIIGQQINLAFAYTLKRRLVENFGRSVELDGKQYWLFPEPHDIAALSFSDLSALQMTTKKSEYLIGVARSITEGTLSKEQLMATGDYKKAEKMLVNIRGIGPWTANYVLMRCLRFPSAFPIDDVGLHNAIKHVMGTEKKPAREEILKLSSSWTSWESYATFYLWRFLY
ncbi:DNA-3-methyladenine glycosylase family protein [Paenibacillus apiarius]|uniref:DNA-3-methyladenine glycosylase II n=1 Tax=Paenibacillus apiarius TaxID=46240 RepID=A0ABT4E4D0_9BACL|nr:DNA-3-methyladenine glycosylase [Paenibacillus apiarius]MCY9517888.1 DNA-3-methyladenine glycosylase [Paenibacillus apiarius]MCY9523111.1 DNA-3-methyladenine glycosylase [Paenibacillus apiarius]MCY9553935.1 DNA-3-methyladenine glycosylase [Paenibacillus apiarius]MCY9559925.1 DNA-3-methyladenine glycosylase [Paenibacillus apiarius]MCY9686396.1 DNA-3-methyladenine glycosylase [Paenibacillus apiarius]